MANKRNVLFFICLSALVILQATITNLNIKLWLKIVASVVVYAMVLFALIFHAIKLIKMLKKKDDEEQIIQIPKPTVPTFLDMYAVLKIPPQYNMDGTLKDMYQLLGIEPQYDQDGNRILTIYEKLGINPRFDENGNELPTVVRIKNRVNSIIKLQAAPEPLTYIPREQKIAGHLPYLPVPDLTEKPASEEIQFKNIPVVKTNKPQSKKVGGEKPKINYGKINYKVSVKGTYKIVNNSAKDSITSGKLNWTPSIKRDKPEFQPQIKLKPQPEKEPLKTEVPPKQINKFPQEPVIIKSKQPGQGNARESSVFGSFEYE